MKPKSYFAITDFFATRFYALFFFLILFPVLLWLCPAQSSSPFLTTTIKQDKEKAEHTKTNQKLHFYVRVANSLSSRRQGFMFQKQIQDNEGILFVFENTKKHCFWMKNTPVSLDIHLLNTQNQVVESFYNTKPYSLSPLCFSKTGNRIIEIKARINKIKTGETIALTKQNQ